jgi:DOPA 4,5-dioxygenase
MAQEHSLIIQDWHAHLYFDASEAAEAEQLCAALRDARGLAMGRVHTVSVGPHPRGSCQITVPSERLANTLEWLVRHRGKFTVFMHANTGDDWQDHTAHVVWLGPSEPLNLAIFQR